MKNVCDIVQDLLPLYVDGICSEASRELVEEHIPECGKCSDTLQKLGQGEYENRLVSEREEVLEHHYKNTKRKSFVVGIVTAAILMIPVIVCLIVNLATGHALNWFFIVLTSLMVFASITVVPLVTIDKRFLVTSLSFIGSLLILFATCCIYTQGRWFFIASNSVLLSASIIILPIIAKLYFPDNSFWKKNKGLLTFTASTILLYLLILSVEIHNNLLILPGGRIYHDSRNRWFPAFAITTVCAVSVWIIFLMLRYWKAHKFSRAGGATAFLGVFILTINKIIDIIIGEPIPRSIFAKDNFVNLNLSLIFIGVGFAMLIGGYFLKLRYKES